MCCLPLTSGGTSSWLAWAANCRILVTSEITTKCCVVFCDARRCFASIVSDISTKSYLVDVAGDTAGWSDRSWKAEADGHQSSAIRGSSSSLSLRISRCSLPTDSEASPQILEWKFSHFLIQDKIIASKRFLHIRKSSCHLVDREAGESQKSWKTLACVSSCVSGTTESMRQQFASWTESNKVTFTNKCCILSVPEVLSATFSGVFVFSSQPFDSLEFAWQFSLSAPGIQPENRTLNNDASRGQSPLRGLWSTG